MRRRFLVTYDVADDKRRNAVFKLLMGRGDHVQFSVFLCELSEKEKMDLLGRLQACVHQRADQVLLLDLGPADRGLELGRNLLVVGSAFVPAARVRIV